MKSIDDLERQRMDRITEALPSKSEKIRQLFAAGYAKADIARYLGIRYQFVYNVLSAPQANSARGAGAEDETLGLREQSGPCTWKGEGSAPAPRWVWTKVDKDGRIALPADFRDFLGIREGQDVQLVLDRERIQVFSHEAALRSLQRDVRRVIPEGEGLVDALIADRQAEERDEGANG